MKIVAFTSVLITSLALAAFAAEPKDELKAAVKKLADQPNYSWTLVSKSQSGTGGPGADSEGQTEKDGYTLMTVSFGNTEIQVALKGDKAAIKRDDEWKST